MGSMTTVDAFIESASGNQNLAPFARDISGMLLFFRNQQSSVFSTTTCRTASKYSATSNNQASISILILNVEPSLDSLTLLTDPSWPAFPLIAST